MRWQNASNFNANQMEALFRIPEGSRCATNQVPYSLNNRGIERDLLSWCTQHDLPVMAYSPLGGENSRLITDHTLALFIRGGHGSPSQEQRIGEVPYIKVSDLRAGLVNINPTNRVPRAVAERFWRGQSSGLRPFDLVCPERTSKNIGDFCVLMPGQEQVMMTKEVIVLRPGLSAGFDTFYLLWAMTLKIVRDQWRRVVFMQTNREDVGKRYLEIEIPVPPNRQKADTVSKPFKEYYETISHARSALQKYLQETKAHHFFVSGAEEPDVIEEEDAASLDPNDDNGDDVFETE
jgi:hypothetical protein